MVCSGKGIQTVQKFEGEEHDQIHFTLRQKTEQRAVNDAVQHQTQAGSRPGVPAERLARESRLHPQSQVVELAAETHQQRHVQQRTLPVAAR